MKKYEEIKEMDFNEDVTEEVTLSVILNDNLYHATNIRTSEKHNYMGFKATMTCSKDDVEDQEIYLVFANKKAQLNSKKEDETK